MSLLVCRKCHQHYLSVETQCPHCSNQPTRRSNVSLVSAVLLGFSLGACSEKNDTPTDTGNNDTPADTGNNDSPSDTDVQALYGCPSPEDTGLVEDSGAEDTGAGDSAQDTASEPADQALYGVPDSGFAPEYGVEMVDNDEDGFMWDSDCDDNDPKTFPGAAFNESSTECMTDADGDGYGSNTPASGVTAGTDCDDSDASVYPGAEDEAKDCD